VIRKSTLLLKYVVAELFVCVELNIVLWLLFVELPDKILSLEIDA